VESVGAAVAGDGPALGGGGHEAGGGFVPIDERLPQRRHDEAFGGAGAAVRVEAGGFRADGDE